MTVLEKMGERLCEGEKHKNDYLRMKQTLRKTSVELESGISRRDYEQRLRHLGFIIQVKISQICLTVNPVPKESISVFLHFEHLDHHNLCSAYKTELL